MDSPIVAVWVAVPPDAKTGGSGSKTCPFRPLQSTVKRKIENEYFTLLLSHPSIYPSIHTAINREPFIYGPHESSPRSDELTAN